MKAREWAEMKAEAETTGRPLRELIDRDMKIEEGIDD